MTGANRGVWPATLWMLVLTLLLGWIPFIGPGIAGVVGGLQAGGVSNALVAAIIPTFVVSAVIFFLGIVLEAPVIGVLIGLGVFMVLLLGAVPLLIGAWLGGTLSERRGAGPS